MQWLKSESLKKKSSRQTQKKFIATNLINCFWDKTGTQAQKKCIAMHCYKSEYQKDEIQDTNLNNKKKKYSTHRQKKYSTHRQKKS